MAVLNRIYCYATGDTREFEFWPHELCLAIFDFKSLSFFGDPRIVCAAIASLHICMYVLAHYVVIYVY